MLKIKGKILLIIIVCILFSSLPIGLLAIYKGEETLIRQAKEEIILRAQEADQRINVENMRLETAVNDLETIVLQTFDEEKAKNEPQVYFPQYEDQIKPIFKLIGERTEGSIGSYVYFKIHEWDENLNYVWFAKEGEEFVRQDDTTPVTEWDNADNPDYVWYHGPIKAGKGIWTEVYVDDSLGFECISYVKPIYKDSKLIGVIGMDMSFEKIDETIQSVNAYNTGYAFMIDKNGQYVVAPKKKLEDKMLEKLIADAKDVSGVLENGGSLFGYMRTGSGNIIFISVNESEVINDIKSLMNQFGLIIGIVILLMMLIGFIFASGISQPIRELKIAADKATSGDFDLVMPVVRSKDEIAELVASVEMLIAALKIRMRK